MRKEKPLPIGFTRRKDGLLQYRFPYVDARLCVYGHTERECFEKADRKKEQAKQGLKIETKSITFSEYSTEWIALHRHSIRESSAIHYERSFQRVAPYIGKIKMVDLDRRDILKLQAELVKTLSTATTNLSIKHVSMICRAAVIDRIILFNPCDGVKALRRTEPKMTKTSHRALTPEEQKRFFELAREKQSFYYHLFVFMLQTGVRVGEALALSWEDVDYQENVIHISKTLTRTHDGFAVGSIPKTEAGNRDIPMTRDIKKNLTAQREMMIAVHGLPSARRAKRIFLGRNDPEKVVNITTVTTAINTVIARTNIQHFSSHAFRDTFATRAIEQGMQPNTLKSILGHASIKMTMDLYAQVMAQEKESSMQRLVISV